MKHEYVFDRFTLEVDERRLMTGAGEISLSYDDVAILLLLVQCWPHVVSKDDLLNLLHLDAGEPSDENLLAKHIQNIRKAFGDSAKRPRFIKTVYGKGYQFIAKPEEAGHPRSIAVLPFTSPGAENYLGVGVADAVAARLNTLKELKVVPPNLIQSPTQAARDPFSVAEEAGVEWVLTGMIRKSGDRIRVTTQLAGVSDRLQIWSEKFDGSLSDVFGIEDAIAERVAEELELIVRGEGTKLAGPRLTASPEAYEDYLMGRMYWYRRDPKALRKGLDFFRRAVEKDPDFTLAHVGIADSYMILGSFGSEEIPPKAAMPNAEEAAARALKLDENSAEAIATIASIKALFYWTWSESEAAFKRSLELNPHQPMTLCWYAQTLTAAGYPERAISEVERARRIKPTSLIVNATAARVLYHAGRFDAAAEQARKTVHMEENFFLGHSFLALASKQKGDLALAVEELKAAGRLSENNPATMAELGHTYAVSGDRKNAEKILRDLLRLRKKRHVSSYNLAKLYLGLGQFDTMFDFLEEAYDQRTGWMIFLNVDPIFNVKVVASDSRFADLVRRVNFSGS
jgi:TolB-like protein/tetratricopeptide (TPR) repeat protein